MRRMRRRRSRPAPAPPARPVPSLYCLHCRGLLPEHVGAYALHTKEGGQSVRLSVDFDAEAVHIDVGSPFSEPRHAATLDRPGTTDASLRIVTPLLLGLELRRRLPDLAAHAWQRALEHQAMHSLHRALRPPRPTQRGPERRPVARPHTGPDRQADHELLEAGQALETAPGAGTIADPNVDMALAKIDAEIDAWITQYGPGRAPRHLRDRAALVAAIAMVFSHEVKTDPTKVIALAAGAMTRLILPPDRHNLPPDPAEEPHP
jgi:hypothetical protein